MERLNQTLLEREELNKTMTLKTKELRKIVKNLPEENAIDFTEFLKAKKKKLTLVFFESAEESEKINNWVP